jgi:hypothetical protein
VVGSARDPEHPSDIGKHTGIDVQGACGKCRLPPQLPPLQHLFAFGCTVVNGSVKRYPNVVATTGTHEQGWLERASANNL